jgi:hypothetical protein
LESKDKIGKGTQKNHKETRTSSFLEALESNEMKKEQTKQQNNVATKQR